MQTPHHPQSGRSMVEMLGTLAIIGVLSAGAIGGYSYAMNKHRTNELIYEATKRAQWVGTQLEINNSNPSLNTFGTDSFGGGSFTGEVLQLENGQIGIKVADLKEAVCQNILNSIGDNTVIRAIKNADATGDVVCEENGTAALIFNRDLSITDSLNSGSQGGNEPEPEEPQEPEEPTINCGYHGEQVGNVCECDYGWTGEACSEIDDDKTCSGHGIFMVATGTPTGGYCSCDAGYYGAKCSEQTVTSCTANSDCDEGYYCKYTSGVTCTSKGNATGQCIKVSAHRGGNQNGYTWSNTYMDWFSAENFCDAQGKHMPTIDSFECYKDGTNIVFTDGMALTYGSCCKANGTACTSSDWWAGGDTRANKFSSRILSLKAAGEYSYCWTQSLSNNSCYAFGFDLSEGSVNSFSRNAAGPGSYSLVAVCE